MLHAHCRLSAALLLGLVALSLVSPPRASAARGCPGADSLPGEVSYAALGRATHCLANRERRERGLRALRASGRLALAARRHARDMVRRTYFSHDSPSGAKFSSRIRRTGYIGATNWWVGENLAWGAGSASTPHRIVQAWMDSPPHRANLLDRRFREIGVGVAAGVPVPGDHGRGATYVHEFGFRR